MTERQLQRIMVKGGVLSPSELKQIVEIVDTIGFSTIFLGSRQDILFPYVEKNDEIISQFPKLNIDMVSSRLFQNIVSSYVSATIFKTTSWLNSAKYLYILELFQYLPQLKINITDSKQCLVPLFSGELNFIASEQPDYWYLYINLPTYRKAQYYPTLVYSWDMALVSEEIEKQYRYATNVEELFSIISGKIETNNTIIQQALTIRNYRFPFYEGMNKRPDDTYWLGLYWRNNQYDIPFLKAICNLCMECEIGKISITPWKSIIIKDISKKYKMVWEKILGQYGINIRHSSLELNWHLPVDTPEAIQLKKYIVAYFDRHDISTFGLTFGINFTPNKNQKYFSSIMIEKSEAITNSTTNDDTVILYNVLYAKEFNPNLQEYFYFAKEVDKIDLPILLMKLSKMHFEQMGKSILQDQLTEDTNTTISIPVESYVCSECGSIYDEIFGDEEVNIHKGTKYEDLSDEYCCSTCGASKFKFEKKCLTTKTISR